MNRKLNVVMVGVGGFGGARRGLMRKTGLFNLMKAYDLNPQALASCEKEDGATPAASFEALLDTPGAEALIISTGAKFHAAQALAALERGLHVFVEKPLCSTPAEVAALLAAQARTGKVVAVGHNDHTEDPVSLYTKQAIDSGDLGTVAYIEKTTGHHGGFCIKPGDWRGDPDKNPGGMLFQCGVHAFHELFFYFGPLAAISCMMRFDIHTTKTADVAVCNLKFASGLIGVLNAFHVCPYRHSFNIYGTKRNLYREMLYFDEGTKLFRQTFTVDGAKEPWEAVNPVGEMTHKSGTGGLVSFYDAITKGGVPYPSLLDGARAVNAVFAAEEAARTGRTVAIPAL